MYVIRIIQWRCYLFCQRYWCFQPLQNVFKGFSDYWLRTTLSLASYAKFLRRTKATTIIQKYWRMYVIRRRYKIWRTATIVLQSYLRGYLARNRYRKVRPCFQLCLFIPLTLIKFHVCTKCHRGSYGCRSHMETTNNWNTFLNIK